MGFIIGKDHSKLKELRQKYGVEIEKTSEGFKVSKIEMIMETFKKQLIILKVD